MSAGDVASVFGGVVSLFTLGYIVGVYVRLTRAIYDSV